MDDYIKLSFDYAKSLSELIITLSISIIGIMITFREKLIQNLTLISKIILAITWFLYFLSIIFSMLTIMCMTGVIDQLREKSSVNSQNIIITSKLMFISFIIATALVIVFGIIVMINNEKKLKKK